LHACVNRLCDKQRTVVMMRLLEDLPGEDVATALGLSRAYVDVLLHRAKSSLFVCMHG
jgi:DNA-directed RNA polymerase specialized sigma24 family protein